MIDTVKQAMEFCMLYQLLQLGAEDRQASTEISQSASNRRYGTNDQPQQTKKN